MNQQQDSQESSSQLEDDKEASTLSSPRLIHGKGRTHEGPKSEHPSTYDESIPPLTYRAQDYGQASSSPSQNVEASLRTGDSPVPTDRTSPEVNAPKMAQRPYSQYAGSWQVPSWARPQQNNSKTLRFLVWLIIILMLSPLLYALIQFLLITLLAALVFLVILGILLVAFVIVAALWFIGRIDGMKPPFRW